MSTNNFPTEFNFNTLTRENAIEYIKKVSEMLQQYHLIIDSFVLDFFSENLWNTIPLDWTDFLQFINPKDLSDLLDFQNDLCNAPLSLQKLHSDIKSLSLPRNPDQKTTIAHDSPLYIFAQDDSKFWTSFFRQVKQKKRHEIEVLANITFECSRDTPVDFIIDVGAGKGHLSRMLAFMYNLRLVAVDKDDNFTEVAKRLDEEAYEKITKKFDNYKIGAKPIHVTHKIDQDITIDEFVANISKWVSRDTFTFGIVGLHPCGDLAPILLNIYKNCDACKFINLASCCYMKLSTENNNSSFVGFPVSEELKLSKLELSYTARELSCHAIESYIEKLNSVDFEEFRVHAFRATLEKLIVDKYPSKRRSQISNVKYHKGMTFSEYCEKALQRTDIVLHSEQVNSKEATIMLSKWKEVVIYYCLRLMFAPLIETIILLDRYMYLEGIGKCEISARFNPLISPRTHLLVAWK